MTFFLIFCAQIARFNVILEPFQEVCIHRPLCTYFHLKGQLVQFLAGAARWGGHGWFEFQSGKGKKGRKAGSNWKCIPGIQARGSGGREKRKPPPCPAVPTGIALALPSLPQFIERHLCPCPGALLSSAASKLGSKSCRVWVHLLVMCLGEINNKKSLCPVAGGVFWPFFSGLCPSPWTLHVKYLPATHCWRGS